MFLHWQGIEDGILDSWWHVMSISSKITKNMQGSQTRHHFRLTSPKEPLPILLPRLHCCCLAVAIDWQRGRERGKRRGGEGRGGREEERLWSHNVTSWITRRCAMSFLTFTTKTPFSSTPEFRMIAVRLCAIWHKDCLKPSTPVYGLIGPASVGQEWYGLTGLLFGWRPVYVLGHLSM